MNELAKMVAEMGLGAALAILIFVAFFFLLKWVLQVSGSQLMAMAEERKSWIKTQEGFNLQLQSLQDQLKTSSLTERAFFESVQEAHRFQREEHGKMIECLTRINGQL